MAEKQNGIYVLRSKSQINYFRERIMDIRERIIRRTVMAVPVLSDMSEEEKISCIFDGTAVLNKEAIGNPDECRFLRFFDAFTYPQQDIIDSYNKSREAWAKELRLIVSSDAEDIVDQCVMNNEADLSGVFKEFGGRNYNEKLPFNGKVPNGFSTETDKTPTNY